MTRPSLHFFADDPLPEGLWLVKWTDHFSFNSASRSTLVCVYFEKLDVERGSSLMRISESDVQSVLRAPRRGSEPRLVEVRKLQAAHLVNVSVGDVFEGTHRVTQLPTKSREVRVQAPVSHRVGDEAEAPVGWIYGLHRVLNQTEISLPEWQTTAHSRCFVFQCKETEYVLPKVVVFRTFYGMHSRLINAILDRNWPAGASTLIAMGSFRNGLETSVDEETGVWNILLQIGVEAWMAPYLAFYWLDDYARAIVNDLYDDVRKQTAQPGSVPRSHWFSGAGIPHPLGDDGFHMKVNGFSLKKFRSESRQRFLITAITGYEWTPGNREIRYELANSNAISDNHTVEEIEAKPAYRGFRAPVSGLMDASATTLMAGDANEPENEFSAPDIITWPHPNLLKQTKRSSKSSPAAQPPRPSDGASQVVSTGGKTYGETAAAPAVIHQRVRAASDQFNFLTAALNALWSSGSIVSFEVVAPQDDPEIRDGLLCWPLGNGAKDGWSFVKNSKSKKSELTSGRTRAALVLKIELPDSVLVLVEVEALATNSSYSMYAWRATPTMVADIEDVLDRLVNGRGTLARNAAVNSTPIRKIKHQYVYETAGTEHVDVDEEGESVRKATALNKGSLYRGLRSAIN